jgi:hypothetical protein
MAGVRAGVFKELMRVIDTKVFVFLLGADILSRFGLLFS